MEEYQKKFNNREEEIKKEDRGMAIKEQIDRESEKNIQREGRSWVSEMKEEKARERRRIMGRKLPHKLDITGLVAPEEQIISLIERFVLYIERNKDFRRLLINAMTSEPAKMNPEIKRFDSEDDLATMTEIRRKQRDLLMEKERARWRRIVAECKRRYWRRAREEYN